MIVNLNLRLGHNIEGDIVGVVVYEYEFSIRHHDAVGMDLILSHYGIGYGVHLQSSGYVVDLRWLLLGIAAISEHSNG